MQNQESEAAIKNKIEYKKYFEGKMITKQGFGFLGRGANVVKFLIENGADVLVTDMKTQVELEKSIKEVEDFVLEKYGVSIDNFKNEKGESRIIYRLGEHKLEDFEKENCDYVIQASGAPKDNKFLLHAKERGVKVYQESSLFIDIIKDKNIKIIGVTGTRGKTTTTFLIKAIIDKYLEKENRKAYFGGNVQNVATLENLKHIKEGDVMVMELDSWILQGFADIKYSPNIAVFTTFMSDHMNYYKGDMQEYFLDKANIFLNQKDGDLFITTKDIVENIGRYFSEKEIEKVSQEKNKEVIIFDTESINIYGEKYKTLLLGEHNKINMSLAAKACEGFMIEDGADAEEIKNIIQETLNTFTGVTGRLEFVREIDGVKYYNDTTATTPDALMVALETFKDKNIILICGGRDKELDMTDAAKKIIDFSTKKLFKKKIIKELFLLNDYTTTGTKNLIDIFKENNFVNYTEVENLEKSVILAKEKSSSGDIILFSPGFASFGMFLNEYDRGEKYLKIVNSLV